MNETASLNGTSSPQNSAYYISSFFLSRDLCSAAHKKGFISLYNRQKFYKVQFKKFSLNVIILYSLFCPVHKYFVYWKLGRHLRQGGGSKSFSTATPIHRSKYWLNFSFPPRVLLDISLEYLRTSMLYYNTKKLFSQHIANPSQNPYLHYYMALAYCRTTDLDNILVKIGYICPDISNLVFTSNMW